MQHLYTNEKAMFFSISYVYEYYNLYLQNKPEIHKPVHTLKGLRMFLWPSIP